MNYWFWVAKSDAYVGEIGEEDLFWGDCGGDAEPGDLALIYRKSPSHRDYILDEYSVIESLAIIKSFPRGECQIKTERGVPKTGHCCDYKILHKFEKGLKYTEMVIYRDGSIPSALTNWNALKLNFNGMYFSIDEESWNKLDQLLREKNKNTYFGFEQLIDSI